MQPIQLDDEAIEILETTHAPAIEVLETLAPEQRDAISAHHLEERGYAEIAAELRCSRASSESASAVASLHCKPNFETEKRDE